MNIAQNDQAPARARQGAAAIGATPSSFRSVRLAYQTPMVTRLDLGRVIAGAGGSQFDGDFVTTQPNG